MNEETSKTYVFGNDSNSVPAWMAMNNGWGNGLNGGWGTGILGFLLGALFNGNGFGGFGGFGGNGAAAGYLGNQMNNDNNTDLILQAINSNGEASRSAVQNLATTLGQDFNTVSGAIQTIQGVLNTMAIQNATTPLQIVNAIQSGDCALASQLSQCCCQNKLLITEQGYQSQIATLNQTNALQGQADRNANAIINAINAQTVAMNDQFCSAKERDLQSKIDTQAEIITQLRNAADNANQTAAITSYVNSLIAPLQATVTQIADKQLPTVPVVYPNIQAYNATPYAGGYYGNGFGNIVF